MPKSHTRKGAKKYKGKGVGIYGVPDPAQVFWDLGSGRLAGTAAEIAAGVLLRNMSPETAEDMQMKATFGAEWPPHSTTDLISLARRAYELREQEEALADHAAP